MSEVKVIKVATVHYRVHTLLFTPRHVCRAAQWVTAACGLTEHCRAIEEIPRAQVRLHFTEEPLVSRIRLRVDISAGFSCGVWYLRKIQTPSP